MGSPLHIIASCADRKRTGYGPEICLRAFSERDPNKRVARWWSELSQVAPTITAEELYVGPYWSVVRGLQVNRGRNAFSIRFWVASAGYGLVSGSAPLRPYSATFRSNAADSVIRRADVSAGFEARHWWAALARQRAPGEPAPRSLTELARSNPRSRLLVIGSASYIAAMQDDLLGALEILKSTDRIVIVCGEPGPALSALKPCWVESNARLLSRVGGSLPTLHARVARRILDDAPTIGLDASDLRAHWAKITERSPDAMKPQRTVSTDLEVKDFIRAALEKEPGLKHTRLLRDFRSNGRACEQSRFRALYLAVAQERSH